MPQYLHKFVASYIPSFRIFVVINYYINVWTRIKFRLCMERNDAQCFRTIFCFSNKELFIYSVKFLKVNVCMEERDPILSIWQNKTIQMKFDNISLFLKRKELIVIPWCSFCSLQIITPIIWMWILYIYVHILKTATKTIFQKFKGKKSFITLRFVCQMDYLTFYLPLLISTALDVP